MIGIFYALLSAALFGVSAPFAKILLGEVSPWLLAGLLYLGSANHPPTLMYLGQVDRIMSRWFYMFAWMNDARTAVEPRKSSQAGVSPKFSTFDRARRGHDLLHSFADSQLVRSLGTLLRGVADAARAAR
jgi:hypothetical protein